MGQADVRAARAVASHRYMPAHVRCLLVAEAPPAASDRYFYFENVRSADSLFREVAGVVLGSAGGRSEKITALAKLRERGIFLIDLSLDPIRQGQKLEHLTAPLVDRCREIAPDAIILIKANVFDVASGPLQAAGLPVVHIRIPFPGSGQQRRFREAFAVALSKAGIEIGDSP
jgi:hypothetical protein